MQNNLSKARLLSRALENSGYYTCLSQIHTPIQPASSSATATISNLAGQLEGAIKGAASKDTIDETDAQYYTPGLPVVSFRFSDKFKQQYPHIKQAWIQLQLRGTGWIVPK
jgi:glutamate decarboxylase